MTPDRSDPALAFALLQKTRRCGQLIAILRGAGRLDRIARLAAAFAGDVEVLVLPPVDVLPYDLVAPSARAVGRRVAALTLLASPAAGPRLLLTSATASLQRVRPAEVWQAAELSIAQGDRIDRDALREALAIRAYHWDERVDEPGEAALRGQVIDIFPSGDVEPVRLHLDGDVIESITGIDPVTQRSTAPRGELKLRPATEFRIDADGLSAATSLLEPDSQCQAVSQRLPRRLQSIFQAMPDAAIYYGPDVPERWRSVRDAIDDAYAAALKAGRVSGEIGDLPSPDKLFLTVDEVSAACAAAVDLGPAESTDLPAPHRVTDLLAAIDTAKADRVVIAAPANAESVAKGLRRRGVDAVAVTGCVDMTPGSVSVVEADPLSGLRAPGLLMLPIGPLLRPKASATLATPTDAPRVGETVVHVDHGVCRLTGLRQVGDEDRLVLEFADRIELLIPPITFDRVWCYGDTGSHLDRAGGTAWMKRRVKIEAELQDTATQLQARIAARQIATAPVIRPDADRFAIVTRRFPFPLSNDQRAAIHAVLADLASGHPTDRLLCGDVGFGKTEVAIRAAAAAVAGYQVAVLAPTSVLARQHLTVFRARFAETGLRVEGLIRTEDDADTRAIRRAIAAGDISIVIGTHGLVSTEYHNLGLVIIDEEQRFGEDDKAALGGLAPHVLAMTATPIPRTMQAALVGLREVSMLATPPQARQPIRTFVLSWDNIVVREALLREHRREGQSFIVCPRISDIAPLQAEVATLVPELNITVAHGRMPPDALEAAIVDFAAGQGDILIATDIIEAGLDIPRANLMLVTHAERFGLAQLHQLRGRVGRGSRRGAAYLLTEPGTTLTEATQQRLATMQQLSALGAGVEISAADLNLRGAGDLFGDRQAGHVRAVGTELYQHLLLEAVSMQRGDPPRRPPADLHVELTGRIPQDYVPDENLRIGLLRRMFRLEDLPSLSQFTDELQDRFGPPPPEVQALLAVQRLRLLAEIMQLSRIDAGRASCAVTPIDRHKAEEIATALGGTHAKGRVLIPIAHRDPVVRAQKLAELLGG